MGISGLLEKNQEGLSHYQACNYDSALNCFQQAVQAGWENADLWSQIGSCWYKKGEFDNALQAYQRALSYEENPIDRFNMAVVYRESGQLEQAQAILQDTLKKHPEFAPAHANLAELLYLKKEYAAADSHCQSAIASQPQLAEAYITWGKIRMKKGDYETAKTIYERALHITGPQADILCNLASVCIYLFQADEALRYLHESYSLNPHLIQIPLHLARIARMKGQDAEERECRLKALSNITSAQRQIVEQALEYEFGFEKSGLTLDAYKDLMIFYFDYALYCFSQNDYAQAWPLYDLRWETPDSWGNKRQFPVPCVKNAQEKTDCMWIWGEQGVGDTLMFANLLRNVESQKKTYILCVEARLAGLLQRAFGAEKVCALRKDKYGSIQLPSRISHHLPMGSLYRMVDYANFPDVLDASPYLSPDPERKAQMKAYTQQFSGPLIGISWKSFNETLGKTRSLDITSLIQLLRVQPDVQWVSLQYSVPEEEQAALHAAGIVLHNPPVDVFNDLEGLAALLSVLDLTVSVDNTTAHLAGALGCETWILLPRNPDWRWGRTGETTIWYKSMRLWRQTAVQSWSAVVNAIGQNLQTRYSHQEASR